MPGGKPLHKIKIEWSSNFAYAIGLIASDGNLSVDGKHIGFCSKDLQLVENFKTALNINNKICKIGRGGEKEKKYFVIRFGDINFYKFLNQIGITSRKSQTISSLIIPDQYFADFLRGVFDGDGTFYSSWDKRWPNSFVYKLAIYSASYEYLCWLQKKLTQLFAVKGFLHKGAGVWGLIYIKRDSVKLYAEMYKNPAALFLSRKHAKITEAILRDEESKLQSLPVKYRFYLAKIMPG